MTTDRTAAERQRRYRERLREGGNSKLKREIERLKAKIAALQGKPANAARATKKAIKPKPKAKKSIMAAEWESDRR